MHNNSFLSKNVKLEHTNDETVKVRYNILLDMQEIHHFETFWRFNEILSSTTNVFILVISIFYIFEQLSEMPVHFEMMKKNDEITLIDVVLYLELMI